MVRHIFPIIESHLPGSAYSLSELLGLATKGPDYATVALQGVIRRLIQVEEDFKALCKRIEQTDQ